jgi:hypothetical protein
MRRGMRKNGCEEENATGADWGDEYEDSSGAEPLRVRDSLIWGLVDVELDCRGTYDVTLP